MKIRLFLAVFILLVSCDSNNEKSLAIHENKKDVVENDSLTIGQIDCQPYILSPSSIKGERLKKNTLLYDKSKKTVLYKVHKDSLPIELSSEDFGRWYYIGIDVGQNYETKTIDSGKVAQEIWSKNELIITVYYIDEKKKLIPPWYDNDYITSYVSENALYSETIAEKALKKIQQTGSYNLNDYSEFLNQHHFTNFNYHNSEGNCVQQFTLFDSHIDGPSAGTRLSLTFVNDSLVNVE